MRLNYSPHNCHAELVSASTVQQSLSVHFDRWTLKQVQGDRLGWLLLIIIAYFLGSFPVIAQENKTENKIVKRECKTELPKKFQEKFDRAQCFPKTLMFAQQVESLGCCTEDSDCAILTSIYPENGWGDCMIINKNSDISNLNKNYEALVASCPDSKPVCVTKNIQPLCKEGRCSANFEMDEEKVEKLFEETKKKSGI